MTPNISLIWMTRNDTEEMHTFLFINEDAAYRRGAYSFPFVNKA